MKNSEIKGYVIDLRNNQGLLTQAINITDFLDDGEIVSIKIRRISETRKFCRKGDEIKGKPLVILINNGSASASEILAGALKDHKEQLSLGKIHLVRFITIYNTEKRVV